MRQQPQPDIELLPLHRPVASSSVRPDKSPSIPEAATDYPDSSPLYSHAAAPPNYGILLVLIPLATAAYITSTRYAEFWHSGFDVFAGAVIGIVSAWFSFRWYHLPVRHGQGWAWGARSRDRAFGIGVGIGTYVGPEGWSTKRASEEVA